MLELHLIPLNHVDSELFGECTAFPNIMMSSIARGKELLYLKDLLGLLPDRETKVSIKLITRIGLIYLMLYRMTLAELRKLNVWLQELVDKGFV